MVKVAHNAVFSTVFVQILLTSGGWLNREAEITGKVTIMVFRKVFLGLAASSLVLGSTVAQASTVSIDDVRAPSAVSEIEALGGSSLGWVLALLIAVGLIAVVGSDDDGDTAPISP